MKKQILTAVTNRDGYLLSSKTFVGRNWWQCLLFSNLAWCQRLDWHWKNVRVHCWIMLKMEGNIESLIITSVMIKVVNKSKVNMRLKVGAIKCQRDFLDWNTNKGNRTLCMFSIELVIRPSRLIHRAVREQLLKQSRNRETKSNGTSVMHVSRLRYYSSQALTSLVSF